MCGSLVSHDELGPENSQVQRLNGAVQVYLRQLHYLLFVTTEKKQCTSKLKSSNLHTTGPTVYPHRQHIR